MYENKSENKYEAVIGLEIHAQLNTKSKMFCSDSTEFDAGDNENTSPVSMGMPGTLPVINRRAVELAIKTGLALGCQIQKRSVFARKNYFYPDLPKGYQISQYDLPICTKGQVRFEVEGLEKIVSIERAHLEEDAGKSQHFGEQSLINYNRSGMPLLEIVSGPDIRSPKEAAEYARTVRQMLRYLDACDGNLEEGSLRCDCNVSVRLRGAPKFGTKIEIKNINSFRFVEKALEFEIQRQIECVDRGEVLTQETRLYDPDKNRTFSMRSKEQAEDYRYFPDPDLLPLIVSQSMVDQAKSELPEMPIQRRDRFVEQLQLPKYDADILTSERNLADYFEQTLSHLSAPLAKSVSNWIMTEVLREINQRQLSIESISVTPKRLAELVLMVEKGEISGKIAKSIFLKMWDDLRSPSQIVSESGMSQINDLSLVEKIVDSVMNKNPSQVADYRSGKTKLFGFFVGQVMKESQGKAPPESVNELLKKKLDNA
jgi:aspartyl-tRNA(Asn)/glutamyl-tRNA(Gln) amidotransferase subunit B